MASIYEGTFNTAALQKELASALEEDRKYKLTDEMKKRAIHTAASYDEFRNFVLCADLKPVSSKELQNLSRSERRRNLMYQNVTKQKLDPKRKKTLGSKNDILHPPATSAEFSRTWRRCCTKQQEKYKYLQVTTVDRLEKMFSTELEADLMLQIIKCMRDQFIDINPNNEVDDFENEQLHVELTMDMLTMMTKTSRFKLTMVFLDDRERQDIQDLFARIQNALDNTATDDATTWNASLQTLRSQFQIP